MSDRQIDPKLVLSRAQDYARQKNGGLPGRHREALDNIKDAIELLCRERLSVDDIREFVAGETGLKIGTRPLTAYLRTNFGYPPVRNTGKKIKETDPTQTT